MAGTIVRPRTASMFLLSNPYRTPMACGLGDAIGSIEVGKIADLLIITGDPADPRSHVKHVWQSGESVYDTKEEPRLW